ncbi:hypothetical protein NP233_g11510 [Leucocoprinus birnbaumii]|uniref:Uncharacterized protein n=1 Tax=Leucocoprinus birnbaumii TaxID=56174 RepID=A0AAD5VH17_9AGAR|nr:hypothetical protein NP233_g11510 [Leucocoprinus birnbaumii]
MSSETLFETGQPTEASSTPSLDQPTETSSTLSPDQPAEISSALSPDQSAETSSTLLLDQPNDSVSQALPSNKRELKKLTSLLKLFQILGCFHKYDEKFVLVDIPMPSTWELCINAAACVGELELDKQAKKEAAQISPAAYVRLVRELKGKHLFPELRSIYIEDFEELMDYMVIFLSPTLEVVELVTTTPATAKPGVVAATPIPPVLEAFANDLAEWSSKLRSLKIKRHSIAKSLLKYTSPLSNLRTLELSSVVGIERFEDFFPLAPIPLETVIFNFSCASYTQHDNSIVLPTPSLSSLEELTISGPLAPVTDFIQLIVGSLSLVFLDVEITSMELSPKSANISSSKVGGVKKGFRISVVKQEESSLLDAKGSEAINNLVIQVSSRWKHSLREFSIASLSVGNESINFEYLVDFPVLEKLWVSNYAISDVPRALTSRQSGATCLPLKVLRLPRSATITFALLRQIALSAPCLEELAVALDVKEVPPDIQQALSHPLKSLVIKGKAPRCCGPVNCSSPNGCSNVSVDDIPQYIRVSRFLNAAFPTLQKLKATEMEKVWAMIWQLVLLCQDASADDKSRQPVQAHDEFQVV